MKKTRGRKSCDTDPLRITLSPKDMQISSLVTIAAGRQLSITKAFVTENKRLSVISNEILSKSVETV
jgi:hypothetical protein